MARPLATSTKYPRRKPKPGKFVRVKRSARKSNVAALQKALNGQGAGLNERDHDPPTATAIRALRQFTGLTQVRFGRQLGTSGIMVSYWEVGRRAPRPYYSSKLRTLAEMNGLDLNLLADPDYYRSKLQVQIFMEKVEKVDKEQTA